MMEHCPTCGQPLPPSQQRDAAWLLDLLTNGTPHREVFKSRDDARQWYVTYGGGPVSAEVVQELVKAGSIRSVYSNCPNDAYHVGRTLDIERTLAERKRHRRAKDAPKIYVDDPRS